MKASKDQEIKISYIELHVGIIYAGAAKTSFAKKDGYEIKIIPDVGFSIFKENPLHVIKGVPFNQVKCFEIEA